MAPTKVLIANKDNILGSVILALATRCAGQQIASGNTVDFLAANGFFRLRFSNQQQAEKLARLVKEYVPESMQRHIQIVPDSN